MRFFCATVVAGLLAAPAFATTYFATSVDDVFVGSGNRGPSGNTGGASAFDQATAALGAPDVNGADPATYSNFYSPGIGGGLVLGFGQTFPGGGLASNVATFEVTFTCSFVGANGCENFPESADIYFGSGWTNDADESVDDLAGAVTFFSGFGPAQSITNTVASTTGGAVTLLTNIAFSQILIVDTSDASNPANVGGINAGFDVDAVSVTPVPVPAALPLTAMAFGMIAWISRRRAA